MRVQNSKLMKHLTKESLFKSSYMKVMNVLHLSQERNQGMVSDTHIQHFRNFHLGRKSWVNCRFFSSWCFEVKIKINYGKYCNSPRFRSELFRIEAKFKLDKVMPSLLIRALYGLAIKISLMSLWILIKVQSHNDSTFINLCEHS